MENIQNIGKSFLFYSFLKRLKTSIFDVQAYYSEIIALSSDILNSKISETMKSLDELQKEPETIDNNSISQLYFSFEKCLTESQYIQRLSACYTEFLHSKNHPINQLTFIPIYQEIKNQILDILKKSGENEFNEKTTFSIYNSNDNLYQKKSKKINIFDEILQLLTTNDFPDISVNFKSSLLQYQRMIDTKTIIQKIFQMKPFFSKKNIKLDETQSIANEYSDSEVDSDYSGSASGSESDLKPIPDIKICEISSENEKTSISDNECSNISHDEQSIKLKIELDSTITNLKSALSENACLKTKIEKLMIEKIELNEQLQDVDKLRKEQIKAVEENALLKIENEKLKNGDDDNSSSLISLVIASSSNLNNIKLHSSKDAIIFNDSDPKQKQPNDLKANDITKDVEKNNKNDEIHCNVKEGEINKKNSESIIVSKEIEDKNGKNDMSLKSTGKEEEKVKINDKNDEIHCNVKEGEINKKNVESTIASKEMEDKNKKNDESLKNTGKEVKVKITDKSPESQKEEKNNKNEKSPKTSTEQKKEKPKSSFGKNVIESLKRFHIH